MINYNLGAYSQRGALLFPYLFDVYMDLVLKECKRRIVIRSSCMMMRKRKAEGRLLKEAQIQIYTDGITIITDKKIIEIVYQILFSGSAEYDMKLNVVNTQNMINKGMDKLNIEKVNQFKYFGITINMRGQLINQYKLMKQKQLQTQKLQIQEDYITCQSYNGDMEIIHFYQFQDKQFIENHSIKGIKLEIIQFISLNIMEKSRKLQKFLLYNISRL